MAFKLNISFIKNSIKEKNEANVLVPFNFFFFPKKTFQIILNSKLDPIVSNVINNYYYFRKELNNNDRILIDYNINSHFCFLL